MQVNVMPGARRGLEGPAWLTIVFEVQQKTFLQVQVRNYHRHRMSLLPADGRTRAGYC